MSKINPRILPGFMELLPAEQIVFDKFIDEIKRNYELHGFTPMDTPVLELSEILLAKAGGETEKQIYRFSKGDNDLCMRFDLTVPFSRFVAANKNNLTFPFKRYQIGKVYRGERPQKGRFREFYQCDVDIVNNDNLDLIYDAEIISTISTTISNILKILNLEGFTIKINNRKILSGFLEELKVQDKATEILRIIDKIEKISTEDFMYELNIILNNNEKSEKILNFIKIKENNDNIINKLKSLNIKNETFNVGIEELETVLKHLKEFGVPNNNFKIDLSIARGLDYYTGTVFETRINDYPEFGSICSGGRYENLTENYTDKKLPGVGISIGLTRLFDQLRNSGLIKTTTNTKISYLVVYMSENERDYAFKILSILRQEGINSDIYTEKGKFKSKMNYADKIGVPNLIIVGEDEKAVNELVIKNMLTGEQKKIHINEIDKL